MIEFGKFKFLTLDEFMEKEQESFSDFIKPQPFCCEEEKDFTREIITANEQNPGFIKFRCNEVNARINNNLREIIAKGNVTRRNNPRVHKIITQIIKNMGIKMPLAYIYIITVIH